MSINVIPTPYIISESVPIESSVREYFTTIGKGSFYTDLEEKNQGKEKIVPLEKTIEIVGNTLSIQSSKDYKNNKEYLLKMSNSSNKNVLDHSTITVLFENVSLSCIDALMSYGYHYKLDKSELHGELKFWLSPTYMAQELALLFRDLFVKFNNLKKNLIDKFKIIDQKELERVYPMSAATNCVYTTGVLNWQKLLVAGTDFNAHPELRYVLLEVAKLFKARYHNAFVNMYVVDKDLKTYGLDTLKSDINAWQFYKIFFSG